MQKSLAVCADVGRLQDHRTEVELASTWVNADPDRLSQVIDNLLTNAIKYTPAGGLIRIQTQVEGEESVLRVTDSGVGIAAICSRVCLTSLRRASAIWTERKVGSASG